MAKEVEKSKKSTKEKNASKTVSKVKKESWWKGVKSEFKKVKWPHRLRSKGGSK